MGSCMDLVLNEPSAIARTEAAVGNARAEQGDINAGRGAARKEVLEIVEDNFSAREGVKVEINVVTPELSADAERMTSHGVRERILRLPGLGHRLLVRQRRRSNGE